MFTKIVSRMNKIGTPLTPQSKKIMPKFHKTTVALKSWGASGLSFGVASFVLMCYVTEWREVLQYVPYYNGRYTQQETKDRADIIELEAKDVERHENALRDFKQERQDLSDSKITTK